MDGATSAAAIEAFPNSTHAGATIPFDTIRAAGAYICNWSGHLLRVPTAAVLPGAALGLNIVGHEPLTVTKISDDPRVPLAHARQLAARYGVRTVF